MAEELDLVRDVLDKQLLDRNQRPMGKIDGIVLAIRDGRPPEVSQIQSGLHVAAARLHPRLGYMVRAIGRRFGLRRGRALAIPWRKVSDVGINVEVDLDADDTDALAWETWLREKIVSKIPGSGQ